MNEEAFLAASIDAKLANDAEYIHAERLRQHMHQSRSSTSNTASHKALMQRVREINQQTRTAEEYRTHTNAMIRVGLAHEQRLTERWRSEEANARAINRAAERAALQDMKDAMKDLHTLHRNGRSHETDQKESMLELKQHLDEANAARASRSSLYALSSCFDMPKGRHAMRSDTRKTQGDKAIALCGERAPLFDPTPNVNEFERINEGESINQRIACLNGFRDPDAPSYTLPHTLPRSFAQIVEPKPGDIKYDSQHAKEVSKDKLTQINNNVMPTPTGVADVLTFNNQDDIQSDSLLPQINKHTLTSSVKLIHPKPFTTSTHQISSGAKVAAMYRSKLPMFTQSEGDDMLQQVCLFTVNQSRDQNEALELERLVVQQQERALKAQWVAEEHEQQRNKSLVAAELASDNPLRLGQEPVDNQIVASEADDSLDALVHECVNASEYNYQRCASAGNPQIGEPRLRPSSGSTVQIRRPRTGSANVLSNNNRVCGSAGSTFQSRPSTQSNRLFPVAQVKSRWQHAATGAEQLTRRFSHPTAPKSRPTTSTNSLDHSTSNIAVAFSNDPLHSHYLQDQRSRRAHATAAVFDTVKTWLEQQEETRKRRVNWDATQPSESTNESVFSLDSSSPFDHSQASQSPVTPRTLKRQTINLSRPPLSSSSSGVFLWLRKHAIIPRRTVKPIEEVKYRAAFSEIDLDASGSLDENELMNTIHSTHSLNMTRDELRSLLTAMDIRFDGKLSFTQFVTQFASLSEWEALFSVWRKRREERMQHCNATMHSSRTNHSTTGTLNSSRKLQSARLLSADPGDVLVPFCLLLPAYHRLRLLESLIALQLTPQEEAALKQHAYSDARGDRPHTTTGGLSLLDLWRVTRTQVKRRRIENDAAEVASMEQKIHMQQQSSVASTTVQPTVSTDAADETQILRELEIDRQTHRTHIDQPGVRDERANRAFELFRQAVEGRENETQ